MDGGLRGPLYLKPGETITLKTLLYGLLLHSGNDAAVALAGICGGEVETFVGWMNQRAQDPGMTNTHFSDPNGLGDENHYASALDMAKLGVACLQNPTVAEILSTRTITLEGRQLTNHNKLLWQGEGCTGMKTGYTRQAGAPWCPARSEMGRPWSASPRTTGMTETTTRLCWTMDFLRFPDRCWRRKERSWGRGPLTGSLLHMASVEARETVAYPLKQGEEVTMEVDLPDQAEAPVVQGRSPVLSGFLVGSRQVGGRPIWSGRAAPAGMW